MPRVPRCARCVCAITLILSWNRVIYDENTGNRCKLESDKDRYEGEPRVTDLVPEDDHAGARPEGTYGRCRDEPAFGHAPAAEYGCDFVSPIEEEGTAVHERKNGSNREEQRIHAYVLMYPRNKESSPVTCGILPSNDRADQRGIKTI